MGKLRLLVVEDEAIVAAALADLLRREGYEVCGRAGSGEAAVAMAASSHPDLVLMDVQLGRGIDGVEAAKRIRAIVDVPIVFLTAFSDSGTLDRTREVSPHGFIIKPYDDRELLLTLELAALHHSKEREQRESRQFLATVINSISDGVITVDEGNRITLVNPVAQRLTGWSHDEALGRGLPDVLSLRDSQGRATELGAFSSDPQASVSQAELSVLSRSGEAFAVEGRISPIFDGASRLTGQVLVLRDVSEQRQARQRLQTLYRAVEHSPVSVVITSTDGLVEYVNPKFTEVTGYPLEEVAGKSTRILKSGDMDPKVYSELWKEITAGREWRGEFHNRRKDGSLYWELASISTVRDEAGRTTHYVAVKEDITARKLAEAALVESEEKYRLLFSRQFDAVCLLDASSRLLLDANEAFHGLFGTASELVAAQRLCDLTVDPNVLDAAVSGAVANGTSHVAQCNCRTLDGRVFPAELSAGVFAWRGSQVVCVILRDITERLRVEELLERRSLTDGLTGIANWRASQERLDLEWRRAARNHSPITVAIVDIDDFKAFNDTRGHLAGDDCLRDVATALVGPSLLRLRGPRRR